MGKTLDYLQWRGDLKFSKDPINDIDLLIFALLSYLPFKDIVPGIESNREISLKNAASQYLASYSTSGENSSKANITALSSFNSNAELLLKNAAGCPRFAEIRLSRYDENTDFVAGRQFTALTFTIQDLERTKIIAFRGTDNSVVGWKEDFDLAYMEQIPAHESACQYLKRTIGIFSGRFIVCGHSKGGNLAIYAGSHLNPVQQLKLKKIVNFDGPGFNFSIVQRNPFSKNEHKVVNYLPEDSMVGLLLEPVGKRVIVSSSDRFIKQHNAFNWDVHRSNFIEGELSGSAKLIEQTLETWLTDITISDRETFLEALFDILGASEGKFIKTDPQESFKEFRNILVKYSKIDQKTKALLTSVFETLTSEATKTLSESIKEKLPRILGPADK
ncbi:MAG: DUF2974 domain-containing protein [Leptolinea sp.]|jgi:hypothetical protein|nr:DUF2974 domain-containing protein [Leptolinea sp.]